MSKSIWVKELEQAREKAVEVRRSLIATVFNGGINLFSDDQITKVQNAIDAIDKAIKDEKDLA